MVELQIRYKQLINHLLPAAFTMPVSKNHCFNRIILDWLFKDCWYNHLHRKPSALSQLSEAQLVYSIQRMELWLIDSALLVDDNRASLLYRTRNKQLSS
ncbi:MAG: hypothetical protein WKF70_14040 [Chitinophagaceae bacterium]